MLYDYGRSYDCNIKNQNNMLKSFEKSKALYFYKINLRQWLDIF
jgi:hypothetical protein